MGEILGGMGLRSSVGWAAILLCSLWSTEAWTSSELTHAMDPVLQAEQAAIQQAKQQVAATEEVRAEHQEKISKMEAAKVEEAKERAAERHRKSEEVRAIKMRAKAQVLHQLGVQSMEDAVQREERLEVLKAKELAAESRSQLTDEIGGVA